MTTAGPDLVIRGGTVVTDSWSGAATVTVAGGRITGVLDPATEVDGAEVLDATGLLVMPGGVDPHCHVAVPLGEFVTLDSFESASLAALAGGTTTIIDFAIPATGEGSIAALDAKLAMAKDSRCDYAFHGCINAPGPDIADVVVTGVPDETYGQRLAAYVVLRDGANLSHDDIVAFAKGRVARFAVPKATQFLDELPRNPTGKVMKRELPSFD